MSEKGGNDGFLFTPPPARNSRVTARRAVAWYYVHLRGYRVVRKTSVPKLGWFGQIRYRHEWHVQRRERPDREEE